MKSKQTLTTDELIEHYRKHALTLAKKVGETHGASLAEHLKAKLKSPSGILKNDTPLNLRDAVKKPGAFFIQRRRPIPLGMDE